tara:strand:- start:372 stop:479 length:108 start_codon:yes stop_codon:yes gene_type:complete
MSTHTRLKALEAEAAKKKAKKRTKKQDPDLETPSL